MTIQYDICLSFAGEDRAYVKKVAYYLKNSGVKVFYDEFEESTLWGKNLYTYLQDVYTNKAKYTMMFISQHYKEKAWTNHERESAQTRAFQESKEYILPIKFDDVEIPGIHSTVGYLDASKYSEEEIANLFLKKSGFIIEKIKKEESSIAEHDKNLFKEFLLILPSSGSIGFIKDHDFCNVFKLDNIDDLVEFLNIWDNAEYEFLDKDLEKIRLNLWTHINKFVYESGMKTFPHRIQGLQTIMPNLEYGEKIPPYINKNIELLNNICDDIFHAHQELVRLGKQTLNA